MGSCPCLETLRLGDEGNWFSLPLPPVASCLNPVVPFKLSGLGFRVILGLYRDNGKGNGDYYLGFRVWLRV